jgi:hypothetical protein
MGSILLPGTLELGFIVRALGVGARSDQQWAALLQLTKWCTDGSDSHHATIAASGAIPALVDLLGERGALMRHDAHGTAAQALAAACLGHLAGNPANQGTITAAGAIPALVLLLRLTTSSLPKAGTQKMAAAALSKLAVDNYTNSVTIAASGAVPLLVTLLRVSNSAGEGVRRAAALALSELTRGNADNQITIAGAHAVPHLVAMLVGPAGTPNSSIEASLSALFGVLGLHLYTECGYILPDARWQQAFQIEARPAIPVLVRMVTTATGRYFSGDPASAIRLLAVLATHPGHAADIAMYGSGIHALLHLAGHLCRPADVAGLFRSQRTRDLAKRAVRSLGSHSGRPDIRAAICSAVAQGVAGAPLSWPRPI